MINVCDKKFNETFRNKSKPKILDEKLILDKYDKDGDERLNLNEFYKLATDKNTGPIPE